MAKHKRRRFRLKNIKRLLCCCCPFGKKTYSLDDCDDGEDDLRGRFTSTWRATEIDTPNSLDKSLYGEDVLTVSQRKQTERVEGQKGPLKIKDAVKRVALLGENGVPRAYFSPPRSLRMIADQIRENHSFQIFQTQRAEHVSIHTTALQRCAEEASLQITQACERGPWAHRAICILPANNKTIIPRVVFQNRVTSLNHVPNYTWSKWGNNVNLNVSQSVVQQLLDNFLTYLQMLGQKASPICRRQADVYSHGKSVLVSFLHMLCHGTYCYGRRIQTFRNHCLIDNLSIFVPTHPAIFSLIFGSVIYTIGAINMSFQILKSLPYTDKSGDNWGTVNDDGNADDDHKSDDDDDDDEIDNREIIKDYSDKSACENKTSFGGQISGNADKSARTKKEVIVIYNKLDFQNGLAKTDGIKKSGSTKSRGIPRYSNFELHTQESNIQMPTRSKQHGRVRIKATLSAASDPPPDNLI